MSVGTTESEKQAIELFREQGGILRTSEALDLGIHPRTLYALRDAGVLEPLARGLYRLAEMPPPAHPDLVTVALKVPQGVICLLSALAYHELTTQIPHAIHIALENGSEVPRLHYPPLRIFWFSGPAWSTGIETQALDDVPVRMYNPAKSVADAVKCRNKIGLDVALEALKLYRQHPAFDVGELLRYARVCRVEKVMVPYLEALL
ncbi:MAG TPA: type IV toxin-antitoxin system AbiEi family antitoxin domain-containing protein [Anaerolineae bacterium]|nr:type IV toxin-antitoxin system AbiEi family antitoxin domain-containing protein [Anaerolineae bacterium]